MTQSLLLPALLEPLPATADDPVPPEPTVTDDELPAPPGDTVVLPLSPPWPVVIVVELLPQSLPLQVTTRHGCELVTVPLGPLVTVTLSASAGADHKSPVARTAKTPRRIGMRNLQDR